MYCLRKALYGLKQDARAWYKTIDKLLQKLGARSTRADPSLYCLKYEDKKMYILVYVDDMLLVGPSKTKLQEFGEKISKTFKIRVEGSVEKFLGINLDVHVKGQVTIHSASSIRQLLSNFRMSACIPATTPLPMGTVLDGKMHPKTASEKDKMMNIPFRQLIGGLLYLSNTTSSDISYTVGLLSRYMEKLGMTHWNATKRLLRYLKATETWGICYKKSSKGEICSQLHGYTDADFASDRDSRKSTSGYVFILAEGAILWRSRKQTLTAQSTVEAEYIAMAYATRELLWLRTMLIETTSMETNCCITLFTDNQGALHLCKNDVRNDRTKHIEIRYHFTRDHIANGNMKLQYTSSKTMTADILTKILPKNTHHEHMNNMRKQDSESGC